MKKILGLLLATMMLFTACSTEAAEKKDQPTAENNQVITTEEVKEEKVASHYTFEDENKIFDLNYTISEKESNVDIEKAINDYFYDGEKTVFPYVYQLTDLNDDGINEAVVLLSGIDFAGSGGSTMVIMRWENDQWNIFSRNTLVNAPVIIADTTTNGYHDIILYVSGGGIQGNYHILTFDGEAYPLNPSTQDLFTEKEISGKAIIADEKIEYHESKK